MIAHEIANPEGQEQAGDLRSPATWAQSTGRLVAVASTAASGLCTVSLRRNPGR
jgi:hypothetical protein